MSLHNFLTSLKMDLVPEVRKFKDIFIASLEDKNTLFKSFGKGFTKEEALLSAYGEMAERIFTRNYFENYYINNLYPNMQSGEFLNDELKEFYQIDKLQKEDLIDFNSDSLEILSIPFFEKNSNQKILFPINILQNLYASNGMAFHFDLNSAYYNAKTEIIERFVKFDVIKYGLPLPPISHPLNSKNIQIYDATLDGKYPVMAAAFIENDEIILSFGCDLDKEEAIKKAYLELMQTELKKRGRVVDEIEEAKSPFNLQKHFIDLSGDVHKNFFKKPLFKEAKWNFKSLDVFDKKEYIKVYNANPYFAIQIVSPSISEVYPIEDLIYNNINAGKLYYRDLILNYEKYSKEEVYSLIDELKYSFGVELGSLIGVIFEKPLFIDEFENLVLNGKKPKISQTYKNILKLAERINEI